MILIAVKKVVRWIIFAYAAFSVVCFSVWTTRFYNNGIYFLGFMTAISVGKAIVDVQKVCESGKYE